MIAAQLKMQASFVKMCGWPALHPMWLRASHSTLVGSLKYTTMVNGGLFAMMDGAMDWMALWCASNLASQMWTPGTHYEFIGLGDCTTSDANAYGYQLYVVKYYTDTTYLWQTKAYCFAVNGTKGLLRSDFECPAHPPPPPPLGPNEHLGISNATSVEGYYLQSKDVCITPITSTTECSQAAVALGLNATNADPYPWSDVESEYSYYSGNAPGYCFVHSNVLYYNDADFSDGTCGSWSYLCLCKVPTSPPPYDWSWMLQTSDEFQVRQCKLGALPS
ncbi:hypothetical protein CYMTET_7834 [Cymbomonas tetramitiformis]|uniref:Uncharacterized protein n=1 Tax=Cymbomonas tetramitiformis TaxID=36881 RepID=A0AAE0LH31_9CHLO|nr:hypothetical protein CYMTET_7834 [Cymbomonas tetramitiformis]